MRPLVKLAVAILLLASIANASEFDDVIIRKSMTPGYPLSTDGSHKIISATPLPTVTPQPTATLVPTATPPAAANTATPQPTPTLVPTATPQPTATLVPTATPQPGAATPTPLINLTYSGTLTIADIQAENASFTVAHRVAYVTTGASAIVATMPASPAIGDTYTIMKADSGAGTVVWTRAGSQTLNGATTRTVSAQYKSDTCVYSASNVWICQGDGT